MTEHLEEMATYLNKRVSYASLLEKAHESARIFVGEDARQFQLFLSGYYESKLFVLCELINLYGSEELKQKINQTI